MRASTVRATLAVMIVGVFMSITATMAIFPLFAQGNVELTQYADFFSKTASVYTGIVGVIVGYYFGRTTERPGTHDETPEAEKPTETPRD